MTGLLIAGNQSFPVTIVIIINLIYIALFDTNGILTALYKGFCGLELLFYNNTNVCFIWRVKEIDL